MQIYWQQKINQRKKSKKSKKKGKKIAVVKVDSDNSSQENSSSENEVETATSSVKTCGQEHMESSEANNLTTQMQDNAAVVVV